MHIADFVRALAETSTKLRWVITPHGFLRTWNEAEKCWQCPIAAIGTSRFGRVHYSAEAPTTARRLGIGPKLVNRIIQGADDKKAGLRAVLVDAALHGKAPKPNQLDT